MARQTEGQPAATHRRAIASQTEVSKRTPSRPEARRSVGGKPTTRTRTGLPQDKAATGQVTPITTITVDVPREQALASQAESRQEGSVGRSRP